MLIGWAESTGPGVCRSLVLTATHQWMIIYISSPETSVFQLSEMESCYQCLLCGSRLAHREQPLDDRNSKRSEVITERERRIKEIQNENENNLQDFASG